MENEYEVTIIITGEDGSKTQRCWIEAENFEEACNFVSNELNIEL